MSSSHPPGQSDTNLTHTSEDSDMDGELSPGELADGRDDAAFLEDLLHRYIGTDVEDDDEHIDGEEDDDDEGKWYITSHWIEAKIPLTQAMN